jgi:hypothetical protein
MSSIIYDFKAIGEAMRKQRIDDWWQPRKDEPATWFQKTAEQIAADLEAAYDPFGGWPGGC